MTYIVAGIELPTKKFVNIFISNLAPIAPYLPQSTDK